MLTSSWIDTRLPGIMRMFFMLTSSWIDIRLPGIMRTTLHMHMFFYVDLFMNRHKTTMNYAYVFHVDLVINRHKTTQWVSTHPHITYESMRNSDILAYNNQNKKLTTPELCKMQNDEVQILKVNFKWVTLCDQFDKSTIY
jgi:hypothetical protein